MTTIQPRPDSARIEGYDAARALAILGMIIVNFKLLMASPDSGVLGAFTSLLEGRAAALFVLLAGVGLTLLSRGGASEVLAQHTARLRILKRAGFLMLLGLLVSTIWPADILRFYGIYLAISAVFLFVPDRWLLWGAGFFVVGFVALFWMLDYTQGWDWATLSITDAWTPWGAFRSLFFNGFHPVFPWMAFLLVGMWLGRQEVTQRRFRRHAMRVSVIILVATEIVSAVLVQLTTPVLGIESSLFLFGREIIPPTPFYVLSAGSSALLVVLLMIEIGEHLRGGWVWRALVMTGQLALTLYLAHVAIGMTAIFALGWLQTGQPLALAVGYSLVFYLIGILFAVWWRHKHNQGPFESLMRRLTR